MAVTIYYTVDGAIIGESTGSAAINYATDALGSVTGTLVNGQLQNTYAYKPYGALLAKTGTGADPTMRWAGSNGYRPTGRAQSDYYVRARHLGTIPGRWTTDEANRREGPHSNAYALGRGNPLAADTANRPLPRVRIYQVDVDCNATCHTLCGYDVRCEFDLGITFDVTVHAPGYRHCNWYQWVNDDPPNGVIHRDDSYGWPLEWVSTGPPDWLGSDSPHIHNLLPIPGCPTITKAKAFYTCVDCDKVCQCWSFIVIEIAPECTASSEAGHRSGWCFMTPPAPLSADDTWRYCVARRK